MTGLLLHLAGPLQSWGTHSAWTRRDTHDYPTRSGLIGLLAAITGCPRGVPLDQFATLTFTIRIDRPGRHLVDFHTVGGGGPPEHTPPLAGGGHRRAGRGTIVSLRRHYLTDSAFTVAVTASRTTVLDQIEDKLRRLAYTPYLGRRSCPPSSVLVLCRQADPIATLHQTIPFPWPRALAGEEGKLARTP